MQRRSPETNRLLSRDYVTKIKAPFTAVVPAAHQWPVGGIHIGISSWTVGKFVLMGFFGAPDCDVEMNWN